MSYRILIVDDHEVVRAGMRMLLESAEDFEVVGEAGNGQEALDFIQNQPVDIVIMDVTMPEMNGVEATRRIKEVNPDVRILALTIHEGEDYFFQMLQAGASGYVPKRAASEILIEAIYHIGQGNVFIEPQIAKLLVTDYLKRVEEGSERNSYDGLTPREQEVLTHIAEDYTNQEIANLLSISVKTVERHRENIMSKLNLHTRIELTKYAIRKGLIKL
ncbi:MAG: response regulator transcription factor [Anaerolineae bacterium]|nr:response regulator transcription factor [Anaerolineae bacterium]